MMMKKTMIIITIAMFSLTIVDVVLVGGCERKDWSDRRMRYHFLMVEAVGEIRYRAVR